MAKVKFDGIVEAVHYAQDGQVDWVRAYQRRGPIFSDRVKLDRQALIEQIKSGKKYLVGQRTIYMAGTFETGQPFKVSQSNGKDVLVTGETSSDRDRLEGVPVI